jgi:hypothetical protein
MVGLYFVVLLLLFVWLDWGVGIYGVYWVGLSEKVSRPSGRQAVDWTKAVDWMIPRDGAGRRMQLVDGHFIRFPPPSLYTLYHDAMLYFTIPASTKCSPSSSVRGHVLRYIDEQ